MNMFTRMIAAKLNISLDEALKIQNFIDDSALINWTEDSASKIIRIAKSVVKSDYAEFMGA